MEYPSCASVDPRPPIEIDVDRPPAKIPRPANAFMLYANANRKQMARAFPLDSNKEISKRLGKGWKQLGQEQKAIYYAMAKKVDAEHKQKYPDYVYNPKEARIRKAMRDANRERSMGVAPSSRGGGRRSQPWVVREQDEFMLNSPHGMRNVASPICGNGFPISGGGGGGGASGQFMGPMHSYNKHIHLAPHEQSYLQTNPMAQLQHQAEMWHYHENASTLRPQAAEQFMLATNQLANYHHQPSASSNTTTTSTAPDLDAIAKMKTTSEGFDEPHTNENVSPNVAMSEPSTFGKNNEMGAHDQEDGFVELYQEDVIVQNPFEKEDNMKKSTVKQLSTSSSTVTQKPLPDFNEAFGSTERGRFQSRPDPQLPPKHANHLDYFLINSDLKFDDFHI